MNTLICAGGSGARVLEALLHLCAMGYGPEEQVRVLVVDPDRANGNAGRTTRLAERYAVLYDRVAGKLGNDLGGHKLRLFGTKFDFLGPQLTVWRPKDLGDTLARSIDYERLDDVFKDTVHALLTRRSLDLEMKVGFQGRPAIGAAAMALIPQAATEPPWNHIVQGIDSDAGRGKPKVFIIGSVFGGTGASAIHPIGRFLRGAVKGSRDQVRIGVGALVPYFTFPDDDHDPVALTARGFSLGARSAVEFYRHLRDNDDWDFDAMFWLGDSEPIGVRRAVGGDPQNNPAHFCELLMATACVDFFNNDISGGGCYYAGPRQPSSRAPAYLADLGEKAPADWEDMPRIGPVVGDIKATAMRMVLMAMAHDGFWRDIVESEMLDAQPHCVPWYLGRFADSSLRQADGAAVTALGVYFREHFLRWCSEVLRIDRAWFFNRDVLPGADRRGVDLSGLRNIRWPNNVHKRAPDFDEFFEDMVDAGDTAHGEAGIARYVAVLAHAAQRYLEDNYTAELAGNGGGS